MSLKHTFHHSYKTHDYCSRCDSMKAWRLRTVPESYYCECGCRLRKNARCRKCKDESKWDKAY